MSENANAINEHTKCVSYHHQQQQPQLPKSSLRGNGMYGEMGGDPSARIYPANLTTNNDLHCPALAITTSSKSPMVNSSTNASTKNAILAKLIASMDVYRTDCPSIRQHLVPTNDGDEHTMRTH